MPCILLERALPASPSCREEGASHTLVAVVGQVPVAVLFCLRPTPGAILPRLSSYHARFISERGCEGAHAGNQELLYSLA